MPISSCKVEQIEMNDLLDEENEFVSDDLNQCNSEEALNENKTFAEIYNLKPSDYDYIDVKSAMFSIRVEKRLIQNDIDSIEKLLEACPSTIKSFNGIGNNSIKEIEDYFAKLKTSSKEFFFEGTIPQYINDIFGDELVEKFCNNGKRCVLSNYLKLMNEELNRSLSITETINKIPTERLALKTHYLN